MMPANEDGKMNKQVPWHVLSVSINADRTGGLLINFCDP